MHRITKLARACFSDGRGLARPRNLATLALLILSTPGYSQLVDAATAKGIHSTNGTAGIYPIDGAANGSGNQSELMSHSGPVMTGTPNIHYIFYGTWTPTQVNLLNNLATYLGGSAYYNILTQYFETGQTSRTFISNSL